MPPAASGETCQLPGGHAAQLLAASQDHAAIIAGKGGEMEVHLPHAIQVHVRGGIRLAKALFAIEGYLSAAPSPLTPP